MLVLTRKMHQEIRIGDDIVITVLSTSGNHIRIGITAPKAVRVARAEAVGGEDITPPVPG